MDFLQPRTWAEALQAKAEQPGAVPVAGGTDLMVELNFDKHRPDALLDLNRVDDLAREFGERVRAAAAPIDDVRGSAAYRLHSLSVMARRTLAWAWHEYQRAA